MHANFAGVIRPRPFKRPGLAVFSIAAMGIGIGSVGGAYAVGNAYLHELPLPEPDRLVQIGLVSPSRPGTYVSLRPDAHVRAVREGISGLQSLGGYRSVRHHLSDDDEPPLSVLAAEMSSGAFQALGVQPFLGRWPQPADELPESEPVVLVSHDLWLSRFGGDRALPGRRVRVDGDLLTVVGVMPPGFRFPRNHDLWMSFPVDSRLRVTVVGRLEDGATLKSLNAELEALSGALRSAGTGDAEPVTFSARAYTDLVYSESMVRSFRALRVMGLLVFLAACANVATLLLVRALHARRETAVRMALGAPRSVLIQERILETLVLTMIGGGLGLGIAWVTVRVADSAFRYDPPEYWIDVSLDPSVIGTLFLAVIGGALLGGVLPAFWGTDIDAGGTLREAGVGEAPDLGRAARVLVTLEVALSLTLLVLSSGMTIGASSWFADTTSVPPEQILIAGYDLHPNRHPSPEERMGLHRRLHETLAGQRGVIAVALTDAVPGGPSFGGWREEEVEIEGTPYVGDGRRAPARVNYVSPGYFTLLGQPVVEGRDFTWDDGPGGESVLMVSESFVRSYLEGGSALGRVLALGPDSRWTVVGVVTDVGLAGPEDVREAIYLPLNHRPYVVPYVLVRAQGNPLDLAPVVREAIWGLDPQVPVSPLLRLDELLAQMRRPGRIMVPLFASFGLAALFLTALGLHGVVAFSVQRRTREVAIRKALGAEAGSVTWLVLRSIAAQVFVGSAIGLALAYTLMPDMGELLFEYDPRAVLPYLVALGAVAATALIAASGPLFAALRIEVMEALRLE